MVKIIYCVLFLCVAGIGLSLPIDDYHRVHTYETSIPTIRPRPEGALAAIGTALVPYIGNLLRPIITNLALGLTNALSIGLQSMNNSTVVNNTKPETPIHQEKPHYPHWDAYLVQVPGSRTPYMLLNDGDNSEEALKEAIISSITLPIPATDEEQTELNNK